MQLHRISYSLKAIQQSFTDPQSGRTLQIDAIFIGASIAMSKSLLYVDEAKDSYFYINLNCDSLSLDVIRLFLPIATLLPALSRGLWDCESNV